MTSEQQPDQRSGDNAGDLDTDADTDLPPRARDDSDEENAALRQRLDASSLDTLLSVLQTEKTQSVIRHIVSIYAVIGVTSGVAIYTLLGGIIGGNELNSGGVGLFAGLAGIIATALGGCVAGGLLGIYLTNHLDGVDTAEKYLTGGVGAFAGQVVLLALNTAGLALQLAVSGVNFTFITGYILPGLVAATQAGFACLGGIYLTDTYAAVDISREDTAATATAD